MKKRLFVVFLALVICVSFSSFAFANDDLDDYMTHIKLDAKNTISFEPDPESDGYYETVYFTVPAKGSVTLRFESKSKEMFNATYVSLVGYNSESVNKVYECITPKYNSSTKVYYFEKKFTLSKDDYIISVDCYAGNLKPLNYWAKYKPSLGTTSITNLTARKRGFTVKYKKATNATGYQIRYTRNSNMTNAGYVKTTKLTKTVTKRAAKKKYYVQVRAYRTLKVDGKTKTYYSAWSAKKSIRTK